MPRHPPYALPYLTSLELIALVFRPLLWFLGFSSEIVVLLPLSLVLILVSLHLIYSVFKVRAFFKAGGLGRTRTSDLTLIRRAL